MTVPIKHGFASKGRTPQMRHTYGSWQSMMQRCYCQTSQGYGRYGARGIRVCRQWHDFQNFLADMGVKPEGLSLERRHNNIGYWKSNCRWATQAEQNRNHSKNRRITFRGRTQLLSAWAREFGMHKNTLIWRLKRAPTLARALTAPLHQGMRL